MKFDLHTHSTFSDGRHSPQELIDMALQADLNGLALTDHDTLAGLPQLHQAALSTQLKIINGIEFSTRWKKYEIHIIGLNVPLEDERFNRVICEQQNRRHSRAMQIAARLEQVGLDNAYEKALSKAGHHHLARPHFAMALLEAGMVKDLQHGFDRFLGRGKPAYVPTDWISVEEAVLAIIQAGGQAVLAHPLKYSLTQTKLKELLYHFKSSGGHSIEVVSGMIKEEQKQQLARLCDDFQLLASTGSDFHDVIKSQIKIGGQSHLPLKCTPIWNDWTF